MKIQRFKITPVTAIKFLLICKSINGGYMYLLQSPWQGNSNMYMHLSFMPIKHKKKMNVADTRKYEDTEAAATLNVNLTK